jgi:hypothetical protein
LGMRSLSNPKPKPSAAPITSAEVMGEPSFSRGE